MEFANAILTG
jgi:hypothetical protein